jgi:hypothetical protein
MKTIAILWGGGECLVESMSTLVTELVGWCCCEPPNYYWMDESPLAKWLWKGHITVE